MATASLKQEVEPSTLPLPPPPPPSLQVHLEGQAKQSPPLPRPLEQEAESSTQILPPPPPSPLQVHLEGQTKQSLPLPQPLEQEVEPSSPQSLEQEVEPSTQPLPPPPPPLQVHLEIEPSTQPLPPPPPSETELVDFSKRAQWLRAAMMGANEGVVATASLMMGVGAINKDGMTMAISGAAGLIVGACTMAIGELVSVYSQYDIEVARIQREDTNRAIGAEERDASKEKLPSPWQAAGASALTSVVGALVPLLAAAFIEDYKLRLWVVIVAVSIALLGFGGLSAKLGKASAVKSASRALLGGWLAMGITYGVTKMINGL